MTRCAANPLFAPALGLPSLRSLKFRADVFARAVSLYVECRDLSVREAAKEMGVSPATANRVMLGYRPDIDTYFRMRAWLEIQRATYRTLRETP